MTNYDIVSKRPVSISEVKKEIEEKGENLNYREGKLLEYFKKIEVIPYENIEKIKEEIKEIGINRLDEEDIIKILNVIPTDGTQLRAILSGSGIILVDEDVSKILDILKKYI